MVLAAALQGASLFGGDGQDGEASLVPVERDDAAQDEALNPSLSTLTLHTTS